MSDKDIGERIRSIRDRKGFKQQELADKIGVSRQVLSNWERGYTPVSTEGVMTLSKIFEIPIDAIIHSRKPRLFPKTPAQTIIEALGDDDELLEFFKDLSMREDLKLLFKQVKPLKKETIKRIIRYIKIVEDEESEDG